MPRKAPDISTCQRISPGNNDESLVGRQIAFKNNRKEWFIAKITGFTSNGIKISGYEKTNNLEKRAVYLLPL